jgi:sigma-B regulation protein RsbU (phosphoserine phosphatase)
MPDMAFTCQSMSLNPGDTIFLYTDGVTEASDSNNQLYSETRLLQALTRAGAGDTTSLVMAVQEDIDAFVHEAPQADDITMLAIKFMGKEVS